MRVLVMTYGTRGDVEPFVALTQALSRAGHRVIFVGPEFSARLLEPGVAEARLVGDGRSVADILNAEFETNYRGLGGIRATLRAAREYRKFSTELLVEMARAGDCPADILIYHSTFPLHQIAERARIPSIPVCLQPAWVPTRSFPNPLLPVALPAALNRLSYRWTRLAVTAHVGRAKQWRANELGLPPRRKAAEMLPGYGSPNVAVLQAFSGLMVPASSDYPAWVHTTGFWFPSVRSGAALPWRLADFLDRGEAPIHVGFGSIAGADIGRRMSIVVEAVRRAGVRAVISGVREWHPHDLSSQIEVIDDVPFSRLFPRMSAVVHHGGTGTVAAALRAGVPQVVCPFGTEQPFHAKRMYELGVATAPQPQQSLSADGLAAAIRSVLDDSRIRDRATQIAGQVSAERGLDRAVSVIEQAVEQESLPLIAFS